MRFRFGAVEWRGGGGSRGSTRGKSPHRTKEQTMSSCVLCARRTFSPYFSFLSPRPPSSLPHSRPLSSGCVSMLTTRTSRTTTTLEPGESWFKQSKSGKAFTPTQPTIITKLERVARPPQPQARALLKQSLPATPSVASSSRASSVSVSSATDKKRKTPSDASERATSKPAKRRRDSPASNVSGNVRQQRNASAPRQKGKSVVGAPPLEVYRTSRSRSTTAFEGSDAPVTSERKTWSDEDGDVGDDLSTCEKVIKRLMPKYRACEYISPFICVVHLCS